MHEDTNLLVGIVLQVIRPFRDCIFPQPSETFKLANSSGESKAEDLSYNGLAEDLATMGLLSISRSASYLISESVPEMSNDRFPQPGTGISFPG